MAENRLDRLTACEGTSFSSFQQQQSSSILMDYKKEDEEFQSRPASQCLPSSTALIAEEEQQQLQFSIEDDNANILSREDKGIFIIFRGIAKIYK